jgi:hypothetical protein
MSTTRPIEIRYSSDTYGDSLYERHDDTELAHRAAAAFRARLILHGFAKMASTIYLS